MQDSAIQRRRVSSAAVQGEMIDQRGLAVRVPRQPEVRNVRYLDRRIEGDPQRVAAILAQLRANGQLIEQSRPMVSESGATVVFVQIMVVQVPSPLPQPAAWKKPVAIAAGVLAVLAVIGYLLVMLVQAVIAALPVLLGAGLIVVIILIVLGRRAGICCPGLHCPGCGH